MQVRRGQVGNHRQQGIVERLNKSLLERLFGYQYGEEMLKAAHGSSERSVEWVARLQSVIKVLNDEETRLIGKSLLMPLNHLQLHKNPLYQHYRPQRAFTSIQ